VHLLPAVLHCDTVAFWMPFGRYLHFRAVSLPFCRYLPGDLPVSTAVGAFLPAPLLGTCHLVLGTPAIPALRYVLCLEPGCRLPLHRAFYLLFTFRYLRVPATTCLPPAWVHHLGTCLPACLPCNYSLDPFWVNYCLPAFLLICRPTCSVLPVLPG